MWIFVVIFSCNSSKGNLSFIFNNQPNLVSMTKPEYLEFFKLIGTATESAIAMILAMKPDPNDFDFILQCWNDDKLTDDQRAGALGVLVQHFQDRVQVSYEEELTPDEVKEIADTVELVEIRRSQAGMTSPN